MGPPVANSILSNPVARLPARRSDLVEGMWLFVNLNLSNAGWRASLPTRRFIGQWTRSENSPGGRLTKMQPASPVTLTGEIRLLSVRLRTDRHVFAGRRGHGSRDPSRDTCNQDIVPVCRRGGDRADQLVVKTKPSLAPSTAVRIHPLRATKCFVGVREGGSSRHPGREVKAAPSEAERRG